MKCPQCGREPEQYGTPAAQCAPQPSGEKVEGRTIAELERALREVRRALDPALDPTALRFPALLVQVNRALQISENNRTLAAPSSVSCAAREALEGVEWLPMSTAPHDKPIDLLVDGASVRGYWGKVAFLRIQGTYEYGWRTVGKNLRSGVPEGWREISTLPAADGEASKREAEIVERCAKIAEVDHRSILARDNDYEPEFHRAGRHIAARIRASLRKDG